MPPMAGSCCGFPFFIILFALLVRRALRQKRRLAWLPVVLLASCEVVWFGGALHYESEMAALDFAPTYTAAELVGTWRYRDETIEIRPDRAYRASDGSMGTWPPRVGSIIEGGVNGTHWVILRDRKHGNELFILHPRDLDPDMWDIQARFRKVK